MSAKAAVGKSSKLASKLAGELSDDQLEGITGGAGSASGGTDKDKKHEYDGIGGDITSFAAPDFENSGKSGTEATARTGEMSAIASASAYTGRTEREDLGDGVSVISKYTIGAGAQAYAGPSGVGAGAAAGVGMSSKFDFGENVTLDVSTTALAKVGAGAGVQGGNAVAGAGASAEVGSTVKQTWESEEFGDGAKFSQTATVESKLQAEAGAGAKIGADGVKADYGANVGSYLAATANVAVGNDTASGEVGGSLIAPGSVGAGMGGEISCEDGKLSLGFNFMGAIGIGGYSINLNLDIQLWDTYKTVGSAEEIKAIEAAVREFTSSYDPKLTDQWRHDLKADAAAAGEALQVAETELAHAQTKIDALDRGVVQQVQQFQLQRDEIAKLRVDAEGLSNPTERTEKLAQADAREHKLGEEYKAWEAGMESPEAKAERSKAAAEYLAAHQKTQMLSEFAEATNQKLNFANNTTFLTGLASINREIDNIREEYRNLPQELEKVQADYNNQLKLTNDEIQKIKAHGEANGIAHELIQKEIDGRMLKLEQGVGSILKDVSARMEVVKVEYEVGIPKLVALHPFEGMAGAFKFAKEMVVDADLDYQHAKQSGNDVACTVHSAQLEAAKTIREIAADNEERMGQHQKMLQEALEHAQSEEKRLKTVVKVESIFSKIFG